MGCRSAFPADASHFSFDLPAGVFLKTLGKYELLGELGRGAFGVVYRAHDQVINRMVALKTMSAFVADNAALMQRFYREAQSAGSLQHPNIVTIYDLGEQEGTPYIAMELIEGQNLDDLIARRPALSVSLKAVYAVQACRAFDYAHKRGIIHRDIKPANVMVNKEGTVKVVDFGIARVLENSKTQTGMLIGTFSYMAPEVFQGEHANARSDVWSFGVLLYELLAYRRPFGGESPAALMKNVCMQDPLPLRQLVPECPEDLASVIHRMLLKPETDRYQTMEDVLIDLEPISRRLQAQTVEDFVQQSLKAFQEHEFEQARNLLQQAILVDSTNQQARALFEKVNTELKRLALRPKAEEHVTKGRAYLQEGKLHEANDEAGNALNLDSSFEPAQELRREVQREMARLREVNEWLQLLRQHMVEGLPEEAEVLLAKVQEADPGNAQLPGLRQQLAEERARRQKRMEFSSSLQQARAQWSQGQYKECIELLTRLQKEYPDEEDIGRQLETAREDQAEQHRQEKLTLARSLLSARNYPACITVLSELKEQSPDDDEIRRLLETARADQAEHYKDGKLAEARRLLAAQNFEECIALLGKVQEEFRADAEVEKLLETVRQQQAEHHKREQLARCRKLLSARRYEDCMAALTELQAGFPQDEEIRKTLDTARQDWGEFERRQKLDQARALVASQHFAEAMNLLDPLLAADPDDSAVLKMRAMAQREQETQARLQSKQREWDSLKKLVSEKSWSEVVARCDVLLRQFPGEPDLTRLVEFARKQQAQSEHDSKLRKSVDEVQALILNGRFGDACELARAALQSFPENVEIASLLRQAEARDKKERVRQLIEQRVREIRFKINAGKLSEAKNLAEQTLQTLGPDTDVRQLLTSAEVEHEAREKRRLQDQRLEDIRALVKSGKLDEAETTLNEAMVNGSFHALDPRLYQVAHEIEGLRKQAAASTASADGTMPAATVREYVLEGPPPAEEGAVAAAPAPAVAPPPPPGASVVLPPASMPPPAASAPPAPSIATSGTVAWQNQLPLVEKHLAAFIGPMARVMVKKAAAKTNNPDELYRLLAANLEREADREAFLAHRPEARQGSMADAAMAERSVLLPPGAKAAEFTQEDLDRASRLLASRIGPIARIVVKKAAAQADGLRTLYQLLAEELKTAERAQFLREAGFDQ
jgi:serine/threonine protein kinase